MITSTYSLTKREQIAKDLFVGMICAAGKVSIENGLGVNEAGTAVALADALLAALEKDAK